MPPLKEIKCSKCGRHSIPIKTLEIDEKKRKWWITKCSKCEYAYDIEEYDYFDENPFL